jgi:DNA repair protein RadC
MSNTIKQWPVSDRPRERVHMLGPRALSTRELVALLIETGQPPRDGVPGRTALELAGDLLASFAEEDGEDSLRRMMHAPVCALAGRVRGIGPAKAAKVLAALELGRRAAEEARPDRARLHTSRDVYERMRFRLRDLDREEFYVLLLNTQNEILREVLVARGTLDASLVHAREVFKHALEESAAAVVLVHNHPSGEPTPSIPDRLITCHLVAAGALMGIPVSDHIIVGEGRYYSFADMKTLNAEPESIVAPALAA